MTGKITTSILKQSWMDFHMNMKLSSPLLTVEPYTVSENESLLLAQEAQIVKKTLDIC
ncbi:putative insulysin [Sesbania bispinosa]|nr:putative insulysin [Sesbania bispinosa]